jgi:hypothetical protein
MATNRSSANLIYRNALLLVVVSCKNGASQSFISRTIGANRYFIRKTIVRRIYVGQVGENIWEKFLERGDAMFLMNNTLTLSRNGGILLLQFHQIQKMLTWNEFLWRLLNNTPPTTFKNDRYLSNNLNHFVCSIG